MKLVTKLLDIPESLTVFNVGFCSLDDLVIQISLNDLILNLSINRVIFAFLTLHLRKDSCLPLILSKTLLSKIMFRGTRGDSVLLWPSGVSWLR
jgi:hypothetical protein